jgi:hypothetical protein
VSTCSTSFALAFFEFLSLQEVLPMKLNTRKGTIIITMAFFILGCFRLLNIAFLTAIKIENKIVLITANFRF